MSRPNCTVTAKRALWAKRGGGGSQWEQADTGACHGELHHHQREHTTHSRHAVQHSHCFVREHRKSPLFYVEFQEVKQNFQ